MPKSPQILSYPALAIDVETNGLDPYLNNLVSVQIANSENNDVHILDVRKDNFQQFFNWLAVYKGKVYFQNAKFDLKFLKTVFNVLYFDLYDTMIAERLLTCGLQEHGSGLDVLAKKYLNIDMDKGIRNEFTLPLFANLDFSDAQQHYAALDAWVLPRIAEIQQKQAKQDGLERIFDLEFKVIPVVTKAELRGFKLDTKLWNEIYQDEVQKANNLKTKMFAVAGKIFNPNSPDQIKDVMHSLGLTVPVVGGKETTKEEFIYKIDHDFIRLLIDYRSAFRRASTYGEEFLNNIHPLTGAIHADFDQTGTDTGRMSSKNPNAQNIPKRGEGDERFRRAFIARDGWKIISCDYNQQEVRVQAELSRDPLLIDIYEKDLDRHTVTASNKLGIPYDQVTLDQRRFYKNMTFALSYGSAAWNIANKFNMSIEEAEEQIKDYWSLYKVLQQWSRREGLLAFAKGYSETMWGRRRYYDTKAMRKDEVMRQGANHAVQGTSADMLKLAIYQCDKQFVDRHYNSTLINFVHDELEAETLSNEAEEIAWVCKEEMEKAGQEFVKIIPIPAEVKIGGHWL